MNYASFLKKKYHHHSQINSLFTIKLLFKLLIISKYSWNNILPILSQRLRIRVKSSNFAAEIEIPYNQ